LCFSFLSIQLFNESIGSDFVKDLITKDLNDKKESHTLQSTTLFRDNSHASKSFNFYAKIVGMPYLFYTLGDPIYDMVHIDFSEQEPAQTKSRTLTRLKSHGSSIELSEVIIKRNSSQQSTFLDVGSFEVDPNKFFSFFFFFFFFFIFLFNFFNFFLIF